jgi:ATP-dependent Lon protease
MYTGNWAPNYYYKKGDLVTSYIDDCSPSTMYVCSVEHVSSNCVFPSKEDMYWVYLDVGQIPNFMQTPTLPQETLLSPFTTPLTSMTLPPIKLPSSKQGTNSALKRKLLHAEKSIQTYKKQKQLGSEDLDIREQLLLLKVSVRTKSYLIDKYSTLASSACSDYSKGMAWLKTVCKIPFGKNKPFEFCENGDTKTFLKDVKKRLDKDVFGMEEAKQEILEFVARKISNPHCKGHVLALCGVPGTGKTKLIKSLAFALNLPFYQINCGGLNDVCAITGHSETYVGSKPGKIVEILQNSNCMNPIIYFDEIDKISEQKSVEINGVLTHLLDEEQNDKFQDNYLSNIDIDVSKVFFVVAFNDESKVDRIVSDRMHIIYIDTPTLEQKVTMCQEKMIPEIINTIQFDMNIQMDKEVIEHIILNKCTKEVGVRQLKKVLEKIFNRVNYDILSGAADTDTTTLNVSRAYIDDILKAKVEDKSYLSMYS